MYRLGGVELGQDPRILPLTVSVLSVYKHQVPVLYFPSFEYQSSSPLLSHFISEVHSLCLKSRAHR